ncbi:hypothetical protein SPRG_02360 [Saprolegnia parasitica CBS 223.65]|uniref:Uncharacterized protein n=1 Tax=Saprolegnia parasitica (strain CBS 223.65) TaxID=695850 RepID=A0A067CPN4_SAPPC|nr:hypothetical protein SPRG_02360 [Saprolegnia parasitica CBS 223.65]KDO32659.1 hypothetical protein SPRG_02360 [Saprolegnia parasitica CBS 223.65]|eukprot:XP_012196326.1 hypothetical protein SPRG_02360 [Saprolegnia parasitica CBS 223.65]
MSIPWPVNRLSYEAISDDDHAFVERTFAGRCDVPLVAKWVQQFKPKASFQKRLLVVSKYRVLTLKPQNIGAKLKVAKDWALLDLLKLQIDASESAHTLKLIFKAGRILQLDPGVHCEDVARTLQRCLHTMALAYPPTSKPKVVLPLGLAWDEFTHDAPKLTDAYISFSSPYCDWYKAPFRDWVAAKLEESNVATPPVLDYEACLLAGGGEMETAEKALDAMAVVSTCRFAPSFQGQVAPLYASRLMLGSLLVHDVALDDDGVSRAFETIGYNPNLRELRLTKVRLSRSALSALEEVVQCKLKDPSSWRLETIDLSENKLAREMVVALASCLKQFPSGLHSLFLAKCGMTHVLPLVTTLNLPSWTATLRVLDLSFNPLDLQSSTALTEWLGRASSLTRLAVAGTGIDTAKLLRSIQLNTVLHTSSLVALDLSHLTLKDEAVADLGAILGATQSLASLVLRNLSVPKRGLETILTPWFANPRFTSQQMSLDMSENDFSAKGKVLADLLATSPLVLRESLRLNQCGLRDEALAMVVAALSSCRHLRALHLENNGGTPLASMLGAFFSGPLEMRPGDAFATLLTSSRELQELYMSSNIPSLRYPLSVLRPIVHSIGSSASSLEVLDLSGNRGGDEVALCLASALPKTTKLRALFWDGNYTSVLGFERFHEGLMRNASVTVMPVPIQDTRRLLDLKEPRREALFAVLGALYGCIQRNMAASTTRVMASVIVREDLLRASYEEGALWRSTLLRNSPIDVRQSWSSALQSIPMV